MGSMGRVERVLFVLACIGVLALGGWVAGDKLSSDDTAEADESSPSTVAEDAESVTTTSGRGVEEIAGRDYDSGDCVVWDQDHRFVTSSVVSCGEPHLIEVVEEVPFEGPEEYPTDEEFAAIIERECASVVAEYAPNLDPAGLFVVSAIYPAERGWGDGGSQRMWCGIQARALDDTDTEMPLTTGRFAELDQNALLPPGTCVAFASEDSVVSCTDPHQGEIVGAVDVSDLGDELPTEEEWRAVDARARCGAVVEAYLGQPLDARPDLLPYIGRKLRASWDVGSRRVECGVILVTENGDTTTLTASLRG